MEVRFIGNERETVRDALAGALAGADEARVAVAFARSSGLEALPALESFARSGRGLRFLAGVDFQLTDLGLLERLHAPPTAESRVFWAQTSAQAVVRNFHPKLYLMRHGAEVSALVGSSNFTAGGLSRNVESNLLIQGSIEEPAVRELLEFHDRLWAAPLAVPVSPSLRETYERLQDRRLAVESDLRSERDFEKARHRLDLAVAEALATYGEGAGRRTWLMVTSPENYLLCQKARIWGDNRDARLSRIRTGDLLVFYVTRLHQLGMLALVTGPVFEAREPLWEDRPYPFRIPFVPLADPERGILFKNLIPELDLFRRTNQSNWGQVLQRSQIELSASDARLVRQAILLAAGLERSA